jgi:sugar-specific transcriptional regulator TrmB
MREEEITRALGALGLTGEEARAYIILLRDGTLTAQQLSRSLGVHYPGVYRVLQSLQAKGWIEGSRERPNRYRARAPSIVAVEARQSRMDDLTSAAEVVADLKNQAPAKDRATDGDLWIYKGAENVGRKLREIVLVGSTPVLCVSPFPVGSEILRLLCDALGKSRHVVRVVLNEDNRTDLAGIGASLGRNLRIQFRFPARPLPRTRLAHSYVFPSDHEVFIVNSFYRDDALVADKLQGLWVGDMDFVRIQMEAMLEHFGEKPAARLVGGKPRSMVAAPAGTSAGHRRSSVQRGRLS